MLTIDMHLDLAMGAYYNRDLKRPVEEIRALEAGQTVPGRPVATGVFPEMRRGEVAVCAAPILARVNPTGGSIFYFRAPEIALGMAQGELAYFRQLDKDSVVRILTDWPGLDAHVRQWQSEWPSDGPARTPLGFLITMEGADVQKLPNVLRRRGYGESDVEAFFHGNWLRLLRAAWNGG